MTDCAPNDGSILFTEEYHHALNILLLQLQSQIIDISMHTLICVSLVIAMLRVGSSQVVHSSADRST